MAYDVFLAYANEDKDMADLVVRRLRALKFKVRYNKRGEEPTFDQKDARDALNSQSMLVLWSDNAVKSDWVRAAASVGHSRPGMLVQTALDDVVPYEPFGVDKRFDLQGMTTRTTVDGFYDTVDELGRRDGRKDLRKWQEFGTKDEALKKQWLADHPTDPLALAAKAKRDKQLGIKPAPAAAAAGAAALAASSVSKGGSGKSSGTGGASAAAATTGASAAARTSYDDADMGIGMPMILGILAAIGALLLAGYLFRAKPAAVPGIGSANFASASAAAATCPKGTIAASMLLPLAETDEDGE